jgi:hypothetical protein
MGYGKSCPTTTRARPPSRSSALALRGDRGRGALLTRYRHALRDLLDLAEEQADPARPGVVQPGGGWISGPHQ